MGAQSHTSFVGAETSLFYSRPSPSDFRERLLLLGPWMRSPVPHLSHNPPRQSDHSVRTLLCKTIPGLRNSSGIARSASPPPKLALFLGRSGAGVPEKSSYSSAPCPRIDRCIYQPSTQFYGTASLSVRKKIRPRLALLARGLAARGTARGWLLSSA